MPLFSQFESFYAIYGSSFTDFDLGTLTFMFTFNLKFLSNCQDILVDSHKLHVKNFVNINHNKKIKL